VAHIALSRCSGAAKQLLSKTRKRNVRPKLSEVSDKIREAIEETRTIGDLTVQEEVLNELGKVDAVLARAKKEISKIRLSEAK